MVAIKISILPIFCGENLQFHQRTPEKTLILSKGCAKNMRFHRKILKKKKWKFQQKA